jgi:hypothetical protein
MTRSWTPLIVWAVLLAGLTLGQFPFATNVFYYGTLGGAVFLTALVAVFYAGRRPAETPVAYVPELSYATVLVALGASIAVVGAAIGPWLFIPGCGMLGVGSAGVARELLAERRRG